MLKILNHIEFNKQMLNDIERVGIELSSFELMMHIIGEYV